MKRTNGSLLKRVPVEVTTMVAFALAIFGVVAAGSAICTTLAQPSPWLVAGAYGGPSVLAFGLYFAISRRL